MNARIKLVSKFRAGISWLWATPIPTTVLLPIVPTLIGVYVALSLENIRQRVEARQKTVAILTVSGRECDQVQDMLNSINTNDGPKMLPTLGISLVNLLQQPDLLKSLKSDDFGTFVSNLGGIRRSADEYQRVAVQYNNLETAPVTSFAPRILPIPINLQMPKTQEEADAMAAKGQAELEKNRRRRLDETVIVLKRTIADYIASVKAFCLVTRRAKQYLE
jgi:hypothetical protein